MKHYEEAVITDLGPAKLTVTRTPRGWFARLQRDDEHFLEIEQQTTAKNGASFVRMDDATFLRHVQLVFGFSQGVNFWLCRDLVELPAEGNA